MRPTSTILLLCTGLGCTSAVPLPPATILSVGEIADGEVLAAAQERGGAQWSLERLQPSVAAVEAPPGAAIEQLHERFVGLDFGGCLAAAHGEELAVDRLLEHGLRDAAARVLVTSAACALRAGDESLSRSMLSRAYEADLDLDRLLRANLVELQQLAERVHAQVVSRGRVILRIETAPAGGEVSIDGSEPSCDSRSCSMELHPGRHVVVAGRIGHLSRLLVLNVEEETDRRIALDPAASREQRRQLADAIGAGASPGEPTLMRAATGALGSPVVVLLWEREGQVRGTLFDRRTDGGGTVLTGEAVEANPIAIAGGVAELITEWRDLEPDGIEESPWFWLAVVAGAAAIATTVYFLAAEPPANLVLVGQ